MKSTIQFIAADAKQFAGVMGFISLIVLITNFIYVEYVNIGYFGASLVIIISFRRCLVGQRFHTAATSLFCRDGHYIISRPLLLSHAASISQQGRFDSFHYALYILVDDGADCDCAASRIIRRQYFETCLSSLPIEHLKFRSPSA